VPRADVASEEIVARPERIPLLIVGGGIGGLATALAASQAGYSAHVIEKAEEFTEIGAGLQLAPNATRMLDRLGIWSEIQKHAIFPKRLIMMDAVSGQHITSLNLDQQFLDHFGYPYIVMHRGDLLSAELEACRRNSRITLENNREAVRIEDLANGARVECADGSVYECDALVGVDGLWSTTRKVVHDDGDPICAQFVAYRGTLPIDEAPPDSDFDNVTLWVGPDLHFVQYCVRRGKLFNQVAVFRSYRYKESSDDWGGVDELEEHFSKMCARVRGADRALRHGVSDERHPRVHDPRRPRQAKKALAEFLAAAGIVRDCNGELHRRGRCAVVRVGGSDRDREACPKGLHPLQRRRAGRRGGVRRRRRATWRRGGELHLRRP